MTTPTHVDQDILPSPAISPRSTPPASSSSGRRTRIALVVAGSLVAGLLAAVVLVAAPFVPATEAALTGAVLCGFAIGWAALAGLSARFTTQPQRWAVVPAVVLGASGLALLALDSSAHPTIDWIWPLVLIGLALWMTLRIRTDLASRAAHWLLYPVIVAMGIAAAGGVYQTVGTAVDVSTVAVPGRLIDVGGHRLHISCTGSGSPTVVMEGGAGATAADLGWISTGVAPATTICVYDRAGRGWSEDADAPQDAIAISNDLDTLLHRADVAGPYVIAGHSFGGLYALTFAARHPDDVAAMVLIDSTSPHYGLEATAAAQPAASDTYDPITRIGALTSSLSRLGLGRLYATVAQVDLPVQERAEVRASTATPGTLRSTIEEYTQGNASMAEAALLRDFGDKPLMVLTAGTGSATGWTQKQDRLAALSTDSVHRVVDGASHDALVGDPVHAATTSQAILDVVLAVRTEHTLSK